MKLRLKYVQAWVDRDGRVHHYFRRAGFPRVRLPGLIGLTEFMAAYQAALGSPPEPIGASRSKPGSVAAAIASYLGSSAFKEPAADTQKVRRAVLDVFKREHGDNLVRHMPRKFVRAYLDAMEPSTAKNYLKALRALAQHCVTLDLIDDDPTVSIRLRPIKGDGFQLGRKRRSRNSRRTIPSARVSDSHSRSASTAGSGAAMSSAWDASTFAVACCM